MCAESKHFYSAAFTEAPRRPGPPACRPLLNPVALLFCLLLSAVLPTLLKAFLLSTFLCVDLNTELGPCILCSLQGHLCLVGDLPNSPDRMGPGMVARSSTCSFWVFLREPSSPGRSDCSSVSMCCRPGQGRHERMVVGCVQSLRAFPRMSALFRGLVGTLHRIYPLSHAFGGHHGAGMDCVVTAS